MPRVRKKAPPEDSSAARSKPKPTRSGKYDPCWLVEIVALMSRGLSVIEVARELGVSATTLHNYAKKNADVREALALGKERSESWWQTEGRAALHDRTFQWAGWIVNMRNRFGWRGSDTNKVEHTGNVKHTGEVKVSFNKAAEGV